MADKSPDAAARDINSLQSADAVALAGYYDGWAPSYDGDLEALGYQAPVRVAALLKAHGVPGTARILDACCGTGLAGRRLRDAGFEYVDGFDISEISLAEAAAAVVYQRLFQQDMNEPLGLPSESFDAVLCVGSMTYSADPEKLLREFCRVAKSGGVVAFTQRDDLWTDTFDQVLEKLAEVGLWRKLEVTKPQPYLPGHPEFADKIKVIYAVYQVA